MTGNRKGGIKRTKYVHIHKLSAGVSMVAFLVIIAAGIMAEARIITIAYRAAVVMVIIMVLTRIIIRVFAAYEEMNSGKA